LDHVALANWLPKVGAVVTVEEHTRIGGLGTAVLEYCSDEMSEQAFKVARIGIPDHFADEYGTQDTLLSHWGLTVDALCHTMKKKLLRG